MKANGVCGGYFEKKFAKPDSISALYLPSDSIGFRAFARITFRYASRTLNRNINMTTGIDLDVTRHLVQASSLHL